MLGDWWTTSPDSQNIWWFGYEVFWWRRWMTVLQALSAATLIYEIVDFKTRKLIKHYIDSKTEIIGPPEPPITVKKAFVLMLRGMLGIAMNIVILSAILGLLLAIPASYAYASMNNSFLSDRTPTVLEVVKEFIVLFPGFTLMFICIFGLFSIFAFPLTALMAGYEAFKRRGTWQLFGDILVHRQFERTIAIISLIALLISTTIQVILA